MLFELNRVLMLNEHQSCSVFSLILSRYLTDQYTSYINQGSAYIYTEMGT